MDLPKNEQELNELISAKLKEETDKLLAKHNSDMAGLRTKYEAELRKAKESANLTAEQLAEEKFKEQQEAKDRELAELRGYKKTTEITTLLAKEKLPAFFRNDSRLLSVEDGNYDKVIKDIKKEYEEVTAKGSTHSTVVNTQNVVNNAKDDKSSAYAEMGSAIIDLLS